MADFAKIPGSGKYPKTINSANEDQSTGQVAPRKMQTGVTRGTWTIVGTDKSKIEIGIISGTNGQFGIAFFDENGVLIKKMVGPTSFVFNPDDDNHNVYQEGKLPEGYGNAIAKEGFDVEDGFV